MNAREKNDGRRLFLCCLGFIVTLWASAMPALAFVHEVRIDGSDAIFLAGRTDVVIPPASDSWTSGTHLVRHPDPTAEEIQESMPLFVEVSAGDIIRVLDPAVGGVHFSLGFGPPYYGPPGTGNAGTDLACLDGISGYKGPEGPLVGVFLDDSIPAAAPAPATLDFTATGLGTDFDTLSPALGQVFYIGDGRTSSSAFQTFIAPEGATHLFLGIPDGFDFNGAPGAYDDNDGYYEVVIGINDLPFKGACCLPDAGCAGSFSRNECEKILKGYYQGDGSACDPDPCYAPSRCYYNNIIEFYNRSINNETIRPKIPKGVKPQRPRASWTAEDKKQIREARRQRRQAMRALLEKACEMSDKGLDSESISILQNAYNRIDGQGIPPADWFYGPAMEELANRIQALINEIERR